MGVKVITVEGESLGKFNLEYNNGEYALHGDHYIRIPQKLYEHLFEMEIHGLPKHCYFDKKEDCIKYDDYLLKHFYLI